MATLTNISINARSMNGLITISDGAGTVIEDGTIDTDLLEVEQLNAANFTTNAMIANSLQLLRTSTAPVNALLGTVIDVGPILNNVKFDTVNRQIQIWNDTATSQLMTIDVDNNFIATQGSLSAQALTTNTLTTQSLLTAYSFLQQVESVTSTNYTWAFGNKNIIFLNSSSIPTFQLPTPNASQIGTVVYISVESNFGFIVKAVVAGHSIQNEVNTATNTLTYDNTIKYFAFMAIGTAFITWRMVNYQGITRNYADSTYQPVGSYATLNGNNDFTGQCTFNAALPTSFLSASTDGNFVTRGYGYTIYARLSDATNVFTNLNTFNSSLPTSTITTTTGPTQFITRQLGDGRFGQLGASNIFTENNIFRKGILPCRGTGANPESDIQLGGNNQFQYRQAASQYNIGIGALTIVGDSAGLANNVGKRNIGIGHQALNTGDNINDCIAIGYQAMQNCGSIRVYTVACQRQIAIGSGAMKNGIYSTDSIAIGTNALQNCTSGNGNIVIAHNGGLAQIQGNAVIIGTQSAPSISDNSFVCVGYRTAFQATGQANRCVFIGEQAGLNNTNTASNTMVGGLAGVNNTTGSQITCLGTFAGGNGSIINAVNSLAIGCNAQYLESYECVIGGDSTLADTITFPRLTLPNKNRINCCQFTGTPTTFTINWRTNEYVVVNSATCTQINLPQAIFTNQNRVGAAFHICRTHLSTSNLVISAFGTEKINWKGTLHSFVPIDSWVMSISFVCVDNVAGNGVWSVFTYNYRAELATDANKIQTLTDSTNTNYPVCFTTQSTGGNYNGVLCNSSLNYNPSTSLLTVPNLTVTGTLNATINPVFPVITVNNIYKPNSTAFIGSNDTVLPGLPTLYGFYFWTDANPSGVPDTVITLPQLSTDMDGCKLTFRRIAYQGSPFVPRQLVIKTPTALFGGLNQLIVARDSATTILAGTNYVLLTTAVSRLGAFASLVVRQNAWYVID